MKQVITPIVVAADKNYLFSACVAIYSLLKNAINKEFYVVYILSDVHYSEEGWNCIRKLQNEFPDSLIEVLCIDKSKFCRAKMRIKHTSLITMYRLGLPTILKKHDYCLYLDTDILVLGDLSELLMMDLEEYLCAGVLDDEIQTNFKVGRELEIPNLHSYVNAGVLLMNLKLMRQEGVEKSFFSALEIGYSMQDQDILNRYCYGKIKLISHKYNCYSRKSKYPEDICILHFSGGPDVHPWENRKTKNDALWWEYANFFEDTSLYVETLEHSEQYMFDRDYQTIISKCKSRNTIYIWGYTRMACGLVSFLREKGVDNDVTFIDSDKEKTKYVFEGKSIKTPKELKVEEGMLVVNAVQRRKEEVDEQILRMGVKKSDIIQYYDKSDFYYRVLDKQYYEKEIQEFFLMKYGIKIS